jgi:hypothetical protein
MGPTFIVTEGAAIVYRNDRFKLLQTSCVDKQRYSKAFENVRESRKVQLGHMTIDHHEADGLLRQVIGRLHSRRSDELEVRRSVLHEAPGQVLAMFRVRHILCCRSHDGHPRGLQLLLEYRNLQIGLVMDHSKELLQRITQTHTISLVLFAGQRHQELHVTNQVGQAELHGDIKLTHVSPVGGVVITAQHAVELFAQHLDQNIT